MTIKEQVHILLDSLPDSMTWDDLMYEIYVRQAIEAGLADSQAKRIRTAEEVRKQFGLQK